MKLKLVKNIKLSLALLMTMAIAGSCTAATNPSNITTQYQSSSEDFPNPERGLFVPHNPINDNEVPPLQLSDLQKFRSANMTLIRRIYPLSQFRDKPISQSMLDLVANDFKLARQGGVKLIVRFAYNWEGGGPDAPRDKILSHLDQLKPILQTNYDVIAYVEAGFIGYWGEWHDSSNSLENTEDRKTILSKLLAVLPKQRMVALRYPTHKWEIYNNQNPLTPQEAFNGSYRARTGAHNDCFLASQDDWGTYYGNPYPAIIDTQKTFLNLDNRYVVQGGETCNTNNDAQPYIGCSNALNELARMHWSALNSYYNREYDDGAGVLQKWKTDGCFPEIQRRLGYRFRLINSQIPDRVKPAATFSMSFKITNDGWASPYNPRNLEVVLRNKNTGKQYYLPVPEAVRMWMPGETKTVNIVGGIPADMPSGEYQVLLNLPDTASKLYNNPAYSIRLANQNVWETSTGYNSLLRSIIVDSNAGGDTYSGSQYFKSR